jgi:hypothetical protein
MKTNGGMYRGGRPNRLAKALNWTWGKFYGLGLAPKNWLTLEVPGRKSGKLVSLPLIAVEYEGTRYLVSMLGDGANWVANVRAAGGQVILRHGRRTPVRLIEIPPGERAPIIKAYLQVTLEPRKHIPVDRHAPLAEFERIAADFPVFRIEENA